VLKDNLYQYVVNALITILIVLVTIVALKLNNQQRIVKIDLIKITSHYMGLLATSELKDKDTEKTKRISETVQKNLTSIIDEYAKSHHVVIIQAQALVDNNTFDITNEVMLQLDRKLKF